MGNQDDHHDAHVTSLRVLLGSILSPKRAAYTRSPSSTSGTASPAFHPSQPGSPELHPRGAHPHAHAQRGTLSRAHSDQNTPVLARADSSTPIPDHVTMPHAYGAPLPPPATADADSQRRVTGRADLIGTLQSKNTAWDALIHGSFV